MTEIRGHAVRLIHAVSPQLMETQSQGAQLASLIVRVLNWTCMLLAKLLQSCPTLCDPTDRSRPGSSVRGILQARIEEWVAVPSSSASSQPRDQNHTSYASSVAGRFFSTSTTWEALDLWTLEAMYKKMKKFLWIALR